MTATHILIQSMPFFSVNRLATAAKNYGLDKRRQVANVALLI
ncbi:hypothetical protein GAGA_2368 [Paraglaciecola agarilytica NO2]|uniref:Uncharacterized protein n=1 Tax=Paraglaciecola agarilytica NO2 TaxID=1125747 RepID=A0ABQ0I825_9ALTE|nr:hypothetical protein GAGA_2368 [Paraglaciecola agarilytica NO2]